MLLAEMNRFQIAYIPFDNQLDALILNYWLKTYREKNGLHFGSYVYKDFCKK